jgi:secondary thiamine-phosphate synthase enzyme
VVTRLRLAPASAGLHEFTAERFLARLVPEGDPLWTHLSEGPDDMPAHVRAALTATSLSIPVEDGRLALGTWQGIYLLEHRRRGGRREVVVHVGD